MSIVEGNKKLRLRILKAEDARLMLEWMHDISVTQDLKTDFTTKTVEDCQRFIANSMSDTDINFAITEDNDDEYLGTVSLKHIENGSAEFAITVRKKAMGSGVSAAAMREIIRIAFEEMGIDNVYWCVSPSNKRAIRFYEKNGYSRDRSCISLVKNGYTQEEISDYIWFLETKEKKKI